MGKYNDIWRAELPFIKEAIREGSGCKELNQSAFTAVGSRAASGYGFGLDIENANVPRKPNSAVARDLKKELDEDAEFRQLAQGKYIVIKMGKDFKLNVNVND